MVNARIFLSALFLSFTGVLPLLDILTQPDEARAEDKTAADEPKAGEEREFEIADGVKMKFCWIPPGEAQLGSPKAERDAVLEQLKNLIDGKALEDSKALERLSSEAESVRGRFRAKGFWLGKYPVTQEEWKAVMDDNPSYFNGKKDNKAKGLETARFPVEGVSWDDCQKFLEKVNKRDGVQKVFGKSGKFALPHEDQWEYAARGGKGNKQPFYWGDDLNGKQANCNGNHPYLTKTKGLYLERTCAVDFTNDGNYAKHPWGLCHMIGNVWQWCENLYEQRYRVVRGGSWFDSAWNCRSGYRGWTDPDYPFGAVGFGFGFRVCLQLGK
jgi:formylglycine-generating enzyme required for sulfatase activity